MENNWTEICAKCKDGDIEPKHCEYYGEPNGCNSPIYGEHPTAKKSLVVGNAAKLREAAATVYNVLEKLRPFSLLLSNVGRKREFSHLVCLAKNRLDAALAAPPRNFYMFDSLPQAYDEWYKTEVLPRVHGVMDGVPPPFDNWLFLPVTEKEGGNDGNE